VSTNTTLYKKTGCTNFRSYCTTVNKQCTAQSSNDTFTFCDASQIVKFSASSVSNLSTHAHSHQTSDEAINRHVRMEGLVCRFKAKRFGQTQAYRSALKSRSDLLKQSRVSSRIEGEKTQTPSSEDAVTMFIPNFSITCHITRCHKAEFHNTAALKYQIPLKRAPE